MRVKHLVQRRTQTGDTIIKDLQKDIFFRMGLQMYQNDLNQIIMTVDEFHDLQTNPSENIKELIELYGGETTLDEVLEYLVEQENTF